MLFRSSAFNHCPTHFNRNRRLPTQHSPIQVSTILVNRHSFGECVHKSEVENLDFITSGPLPPNPGEIILGNSLTSFIKELKSIYDVILIDTPPVGIVTDAVISYKLADNSLYVMRAKISPKSFIENINSFSETQKLNNLAIILNGIERSVGRYGYGYKSGYGYQYGNNTYGYGYGYLTKIHNSYYGEEEEVKNGFFNKLLKKLNKDK